MGHRMRDQAGKDLPIFQIHPSRSSLNYMRRRSGEKLNVVKKELPT